MDLPHSLEIFCGGLETAKGDVARVGKENVDGALIGFDAVDEFADRFLV